MVGSIDLLVGISTQLRDFLKKELTRRMLLSLDEEALVLGTMTIVMPAYNEGLGIADGLARLNVMVEDLRRRYEVEVVVVDDGSTDQTPEVLVVSAASYPYVRIYTHLENRGLVEAMKTGARAAAGDIVVMLDADLSYAPEIVEPLVSTLIAERASAVIASPYMRGGHVGNVPFDRFVASRVANWLLSLCVGGRIKTFTGMVRAYERQTLLEIMQRETHGEFNAWVLAELLRTGHRIVEIPAALVWPKTRTEAPSRFTFAKLMSRARLVVGTARVLARSKRPADAKNRGL